MKQVHQKILAEFKRELPLILAGDEPKRYCERCGMTFDVVDDYSLRAEVTVCAEPGCKRIFQHATALPHGGSPAIVRVKR